MVLGKPIKSKGDDGRDGIVEAARTVRGVRTIYEGRGRVEGMGRVEEGLLGRSKLLLSF